MENSKLAKVELFKWVASCVDVKPDKLEDFKNGAVFCLLLDFLYPGVLPKSRINMKAKLEYENLANLKLLSTSMLKAAIAKKFDSQKIAKGSCQPILELLQWFRLEQDKDNSFSRRASFGESHGSYRQSIINRKDLNLVLSFQEPTKLKEKPTKVKIDVADDLNAELFKKVGKKLTCFQEFISHKGTPDEKVSQLENMMSSKSPKKSEDAIFYSMGTNIVSSSKPQSDQSKKASKSLKHSKHEDLMQAKEEDSSAVKLEEDVSVLGSNRAQKWRNSFSASRRPFDLMNLFENSSSRKK